jgi:hypothetical protein
MDWQTPLFAATFRLFRPEKAAVIGVSAFVPIRIICVCGASAIEHRSLDDSVIAVSKTCSTTRRLVERDGANDYRGTDFDECECGEVCCWAR